MRWKEALSHETKPMSQRSQIDMSSLAFISACSTVSQRVPLLQEGKWICVSSDWLNKCKREFVSQLPPVHLPVCVTVWMSDKLQHKPSICAVGCVCFTPPLPPCWCDRASKQHSVVCPQRGSCLPLRIHPNCRPLVRQRHSLEVTSRGCPQAMAGEGGGGGGRWGSLWCLAWIISFFNMLGTSEKIGIKLCSVPFSDTLQ